MARVEGPVAALEAESARFGDEESRRVAFVEEEDVHREKEHHHYPGDLDMLG